MARPKKSEVQERPNPTEVVRKYLPEDLVNSHDIGAQFTFLYKLYREQVSARKASLEDISPSAKLLKTEWLNNDEAMTQAEQIAKEMLSIMRDAMDTSPALSACLVQVFDKQLLPLLKEDRDGFLVQETNKMREASPSLDIDNLVPKDDLKLIRSAVEVGSFIFGKNLPTGIEMKDGQILWPNLPSEQPRKRTITTFATLTWTINDGTTVVEVPKGTSPIKVWREYVYKGNDAPSIVELWDGFKNEDGDRSVLLDGKVHTSVASIPTKTDSGMTLTTVTITCQNTGE